MCGTLRSEVLVGTRGWVLVFEVGALLRFLFCVFCCCGLAIETDAREKDPDGRRIRLYSREDHGGRETPSYDRRWLGDG